MTCSPSPASWGPRLPGSRMDMRAWCCCWSGRDALGRVYILSNNHVLANSNGATIGDPEYQPGPYDGGTSADQIATLTDFQVISFASNGSNTIDAAIALSSTDLLDNAVPSDDGYGMP